jgi:hypothetical protein
MARKAALKVVEERCRLGVGAGHDDPGHAHDVELEAGGREALHLLVLRDEHLAALVAALLHAGLLVLDVVAGHADLDEAPDQVADVGVAAVAGVGVGDDEGAEVHLGRAPALLLGHARAREELVPVGGEERADDGRGLVGHLAERVAGQVGPWVLVGRALGRGRPAAQVDALDPHLLHRHGLAGRVGAEGGDRLLLVVELPQPRIEPLGGAAGHRVVGADGAALLHHLARRVDPLDSLEAGAREPLAQLCDFLVEVHRSPPGLGRYF